jgi:hypothetical protein
MAIAQHPCSHEAQRCGTCGCKDAAMWGHINVNMACPRHVSLLSWPSLGVQKNNILSENMVVVVWTKMQR